VCVASGCPLARGSVCGEYPNQGVALAWVNVTEAAVKGDMNGTKNGTTSGAPIQSNGFPAGGVGGVLGLVAAVVGGFVWLL